MTLQLIVLFLFLLINQKLACASISFGKCLFENFHYRMNGLDISNLNIRIDDTTSEVNASQIHSSRFSLKDLEFICLPGPFDPFFSPQRIIAGCSKEGRVLIKSVTLINDSNRAQDTVIDRILTTIISSLNHINHSQRKFNNLENIQIHIGEREYSAEIETTAGDLKIAGELWVDKNVIYVKIKQAKLGIIGVKTILLNEIKKQEQDGFVLVNSDIVEIRI